MDFLGIDPGASGALAFLREDGELLGLWKMPETEKDLANIFIEIDSFPSSLKGLIERVHSMPGNSARSMFTFGKNYGMLRMGMICQGISFEEITPQGWQKEFGITQRKKGEQKTKHKNRLKQKAQQLFPSVKVTNWNADALLLAEFARRRGY